MQKLGVSRRQIFERLDRPVLKPLPRDPYEMAEWKNCRVNSVPYQLIHEQVEARFTHSIAKLGARFLQDQNSWIFMPLSVSYAVSQDGQRWDAAGKMTNDVDPHAEGVVLKDLEVPVHPARRARWVRVQARAPVLCPDWHKGAGNRSFIFADEILVE